MRKFFGTKALIAILLIFVLASAASAQVIVRGSEVSVTFGKAVAAQYMKDYPGTSVDVAGGGKDNAIMMLAAGSCDIANSALSLAEQDRQDVLDALAKAKADGHPIKEIAVAIDCVDFFTHESNPVFELTLDQLRKIYEGTYTNWNQVGGPNMTINVYQSGQDDHKYFSIKNWLIDGTSFSPNSIQVDKKEIFGKVADDPAGIGYDGVFYVGDSLAASGDVVNSLWIAGPDDAKAYAPSRKYPVSRNLYMFYRDGDFSAEAKAFLDYMLQPKAQRIIGGYVSALMPPARTFELAFAPKDKPEQTVRFTEDLASEQNVMFDYVDATEYVIYARNNSYVDGTLPKIVAEDGTVRNVTNGGLFIVNRKTDPKTFDGLMNCNITELRPDKIARGDVMTFNYNGCQITVRFGTSTHQSGSSGCSTGAFALLLAMLPAAAVFGKRR